MPAKTEEALYASLQRGMRAAAELDVVKPLLADRRESLIRQAVLDFQSKKLDGMGALLFVASLVENSRILDDLEFVKRQGRRDGEKLTEA